MALSENYVATGVTDMTGNKNYITPQGLQALQNELHQLLHVERPKVVETVAWAASNGDRSENADYIYGKRRLREIDRRVRWLTERLELAQVIDPQTIRTDRVVFASCVLLENEAGDWVRYQLVGEDEIDVQRGLISWRSPLASALLGKVEGDEVQVQTPKGVVTYTILKIARFWHELEG
ncbi:MAG: transcription elongation factor GreB [Bdellovibrionaceae bacterium]|jgi:transcription elongation factor GreB|nr:transcription elongation factor GreB [Pseudobdellovibrionaceae bacterium]